MQITQQMKGMSAAACLALAATAQADIRVESSRHSNIDFQSDDLVITNAADDEARISPAGDLVIAGKAVATNAEQRKLLQQYYGGMRDIEHRGLAIGEHALDMVGGMLGTLLTAVLSGDEDKELDRKMRQKAEPLKDEARALCKDVRDEHALQDKIAGEIPAFKPYAVMDADSDHDCHIDDNEV
jgi:Protein of unknown function (DUF2884)